MSFNNNTVSPARGGFAIADLQKLQPLGDSNRQKRERRPPKPPTKPDPIDIDPDIDTSQYTPDGHVEGDEQSIRLDISA